MIFHVSKILKEAKDLVLPGSHLLYAVMCVLIVIPKITLIMSSGMVGITIISLAVSPSINQIPLTADSWLDEFTCFVQMYTKSDIACSKI